MTTQGQNISNQADLDILGTKPTLTENLFRSIAEEWFERIQPTIKLSSASRYRNILDNQLLPAFAESDIMEISRADVSSFATNMLLYGGKKKTGLAPKTASSVLSVLKLIMHYANQVRCLNVVDLNGIYIRQAQKRLRVFSRREQETINQYLLSGITPTKLGVLLCLYTGLRNGELCALTWGDVDLHEKKIHVSKTMQRIQMPKGSKPQTAIIITAPKSESSVREIPIPEELFQLLRWYRKPADHYFLTAHDKLFMEPRTLENHFHKMMRQCGIQDATVHTCRHTFATRCVELGFDIKTLSEILGHASVGITMNRYVHPSMEMKQKNMEKLSALISRKQ